MKRAHSSKRLTLRHMRSLAAKRGGRCLSDAYETARTYLTWQCARGHVWQAIPQNIKKDSWCPFCAKKKVTLEDMQARAAKKGGKCLATEYRNNRTKLKFQCAKGHIWKTMPLNIQQGAWCRFCLYDAMKGTLEAMQQIAATRGGRCLSTGYTNAYTKLEWECAKGHRWKQVPGNISYGTWCPRCARKK